MSYLLVILAIGVLLLVHELGHLLAAFRMGMPVKRFSIGMGPVLKRIDFKGVEYCISLLPLGGYVLLKVEDEKDYFRLPVRKRIFFALGGPAANLLFALPLFGVINLLASGVSLQGLLITPFVQVAGISWSMLEAVRTLFSSPEQLSSIVGIVAQGGQVIAGWIFIIFLMVYATVLDVNRLT